MRSEEEFRAFFRTELLPELRSLERRRKEVWRRLKRGDVLTLALVCLVAAVYFRDPRPLLAPVLYALLRMAGPLASLRRDFKREIVGRVIRFCDPSLEYRPSMGMPPDVVRASALFENEYSDQTGEDYVEGLLGGTQFRFSELTLSHKDSARSRQSRTVFRGLFFVADFNKSFHGRTILLPDRAERILGTFGRALQQLSGVGGGHAIELEDSEFERYFVVYATDEVEARYILSPSLMQRIVRFRETSGAQLRIAFVNECVYVAVPLKQDLFALRVGTSFVNEEAVRGWIDQLQFVMGIVEDLDLGTRIWSKGGPTPSVASPNASPTNRLPGQDSLLPHSATLAASDRLTRPKSL